MEKFWPQLTPKEIIQAGSFGGTYFDGVLCNHEDYPSDWFEGLPLDHYAGKKYNKQVNRYKVKAGMNQKQWEAKGWITPDCPRGWFQWYCNYYIGIRSQYDNIQIERWAKFDRWVRQFQKNPSPVIAQSLLHWAYNLNNIL